MKLSEKLAALEEQERKAAAFTREVAIGVCRLSR